MPTIQNRRDTAANWLSTNKVLASGEFGYDTTNGIVKIGDGTTGWNSLAQIGGGDPNVFRGIVALSEAFAYTDIRITIPKVTGSVGYFPNVRITLQLTEDDGLDLLFEAIMGSGTNSAVTPVYNNSMIVGKGQGSADFVLVSTNYVANLVIAEQMDAPYNNLFVKIEAYDPFGVLDMANTSVIFESEYSSPAPSPIFTV